MPVQYGGGLRTPEAVRGRAGAGAERVIVGTAALRDVDFLDDVVAALRPRVVVSVDVRGGHIATAGWTQVSDLPASEAFMRLHGRGVDSFVYTDADRDGALAGPDLDAVRAVAAAVRGRFLYAGGIGALEHLRALRGLRQVNLAGVVVGKALYEGRFTVAEGQAALDGRQSEYRRPADGGTRRAIGRRAAGWRLPPRHARASSRAAPSRRPVTEPWIGA